MSTPTRSPLSLSVASTGVQTGRAVVMRGGRGVTRVTAQIVVTGSTKAAFRMQGSVDGVTWVNLGAAATTMTSTAAQTITSTGANAWRMLRVVQNSMVTHAGGVAARASITGA